MKIRTGLVSNSSSCSFTIAVLPDEQKTEEEPTRLDIVKAFLNVGRDTFQKAGRVGVVVETIAEFKTAIQNEIELLDLDIEFSKKRTEALEKLVDNQEAMNAWVAMVDIDAEYKRLAAPLLRAQRENQKFSDHDASMNRTLRSLEKIHRPSTSSEEFRAKIRWNDKTQGLKTRRNELQDLLKKLESVPDEADVVYAHQDNYSKRTVDEILKIFRDKKWAVVVDEWYG